jgi:hypothetical protein
MLKITLHGLLTLSNQASSTINTSRMELHEFKVLQWQACACNHSITVARACVRARAAKVSPSVPASCKHRFVRTEAVEGTIFHVEGNYTDTLAILHDKVERKEFDEKVRIVTQGLAIEGM